MDFKTIQHHPGCHYARRKLKMTEDSPCQCPKGASPVQFTCDETRRPVKRQDLTMVSPNGAYSGRVAFVLRNVLSPSECQQIIADSETRGYQNLEHIYPKDYRDNGRVVVRDESLASLIFERVRGKLPQEFETHGSRSTLLGLNECFRSCKYEAGGHFKPHHDAHFCRDAARGERSYLTVMMYLNEGFTGGHTNFLDERGGVLSRGEGGALVESIVPEPGLAVVFEHNMLHEGGQVVDGFKYIFRTDVMYCRSEKEWSGYDIIQPSCGVM